jgi:hypothetical protein
LLWDPFDTVADSQRGYRQTDQLLLRTETIADSGRVVRRDFNVTPDSALMTMIPQAASTIRA